MDIQKLLSELKTRIESRTNLAPKYLASRGNDNGFERLVPEVLMEIQSDYPNAFTVKTNFGHFFPDITVTMNGKHYGLELKSRQDGTWTTNGNSVFESISSTDISEIFLLFGSRKKKLPQYEVRFKPYWATLSAIAVTHSPRFSINMDARDTVFKSALDYRRLREDDEQGKVRFVQHYLIAHADPSKWFIPNEKDFVPTIINNVSKAERKPYLLQAMILYPQDLLTFKSADYERIALFYFNSYYMISYSLRDLFSAGGAWPFSPKPLPHIFGEYYNNSSELKKILADPPKGFEKLAYESWNELKLGPHGLELSEPGNFLTHFREVLDFLGSENQNRELRQISDKSLSQILSI